MASPAHAFSRWVKYQLDRYSSEHPSGSYGVGVDLVHRPRIAQFLKRHACHVADRVLTRSEKQTWLRKKRSSELFAKYFAAKEAFFKATGQGWMGLEGFKSFEIKCLARGRFHGRALSNDEGYEGYGRFFNTAQFIGAHIVLYKSGN